MSEAMGLARDRRRHPVSSFHADPDDLGGRRASQNLHNLMVEVQEL